MTPEQAFNLLDRILAKDLQREPEINREFLVPNYNAILEALKPKPVDSVEQKAE